MSIITCLSAILLIAAAGQSPADAPEARDTERDIRNVLYDRPLEMGQLIGGVLTFEKQMRRPHLARSGNGDEMALQRWSIAFGDGGSLRCKVVSDNPAGPDNGPLLSITMFGRTPEWSWLLSNNELLIVQNLAIMNNAPVLKEVEIPYEVLRLLIRQAPSEISRALASPGLGDESQIHVLDRDAHSPSAVVGIDELTIQYEFERKDDLLVLRGAETSKGGTTTTFRSSYSGYRRENGLWIPSTVEGYRIFDSGSRGPILFDRYTDIHFIPASASGDQLSQYASDVPKPGDPDIDFAVQLVTTVSYDGVSYSTFGGFPVAKAE